MSLNSQAIANTTAVNPSTASPTNNVEIGESANVANSANLFVGILITTTIITNLFLFEFIIVVTGSSAVDTQLTTSTLIANSESNSNNANSANLFVGILITTSIITNLFLFEFIICSYRKLGC
jgi:hypothetical protein